MRIPAALLRFNFGLLVLVLGARADAAGLIVHLAQGTQCTSALALGPTATPGQDGPGVLGKVSSGEISFTDLTAGTPYDLRLVLAGGAVLHGVNMDWYTAEAAQPGAAPLDDDDRKQIGALVSDVKSFYDISRVLDEEGDHNRATVLVERIRSSAFHGAADGEVVWRVELWYFTNDFGGWSELQQTNKVLMRVRFKSRKDYQATTGLLHWVPALGGIVLDGAGAAKEITLPAGSRAPVSPR